MSQLESDRGPLLSELASMENEGGVMPEIIVSRRRAHVPEQALPVLGEPTTLDGHRMPPTDPNTDAYELDRLADDGAPFVETV